MQGIQLSDINYIWIKLLKQVIEKGSDFNPRGIETKEILGNQVVVDMSRAVIAIPERKLGYRFMTAEASWIIQGKNDLAYIGKYANQIKEYSDDGKFFNGAYGPPLIDQLPYVMKTLLNDKASRQAVVNLWRNKPGVSKDIPCTLSLQFFIRNSKLHTVTTMRSNDIWLGFPYDVFNFSAISNYLLLLLKDLDESFHGLSLGNLYLTAGSHHLYNSHLSKAKSILNKYEDLTTEKKLLSLDHLPSISNTHKSPSSFVEYLKTYADTKNV